MIIHVPPKPILLDLLCNEYDVFIPAFNKSYYDTVNRYREAHRKYHVLSHAVEVFSYCWSHRREVNETLPLLLAAWWHDVIYDPYSKTNEEDSAEYAAEQCDNWELPTYMKDQVRSLILATKNHVPDPHYPFASRVLIDADLLPFSLPLKDVLHRGKLIRMEHAEVPDQQFYAGRREVLTKFTKRDPFYFHPDLDGNLAKTNIEVEIMGLDELTT